MNLARFELVADKQVLDGRYQLFAAQKVESVPPALEFQESLLLPLGVSKDRVELFP